MSTRGAKRNINSRYEHWLVSQFCHGEADGYINEFSCYTRPAALVEAGCCSSKVSATFWQKLITYFRGYLLRRWLRRKAEAQVQQVVDVVAPGPLKVSHHCCATFVKHQSIPPSHCAVCSTVL